MAKHGMNKKFHGFIPMVWPQESGIEQSLKSKVYMISKLLFFVSIIILFNFHRIVEKLLQIIQIKSLFTVFERISSYSCYSFLGRNELKSLQFIFIQRPTCSSIFPETHCMIVCGNIQCSLH